MTAENTRHVIADAGTCRLSPIDPLRPHAKDKPGRDVDTFGAWPERGLLGTRFGPNERGKTW
jgi:hypothetical protein